MSPWPTACRGSRKQARRSFWQSPPVLDLRTFDPSACVDAEADGATPATLREKQEGIAVSGWVGMPYEEALLLYVLGRLKEELGDRQGARTALADALATFRRLDARPYIERSEQALRTLGNS